MTEKEIIDALYDYLDTLDKSNDEDEDLFQEENKMKTVYYSEDGKKFENKKDCLEYEEKQAAKEADRIKKEQERDARQKEVEEAYKVYKNLLEKFLDDYGYYTKKYTDASSDYPFLSSLFKAFDL